MKMSILIATLVLAGCIESNTLCPSPIEKTMAKDTCIALLADRLVRYEPSAPPATTSADREMLAAPAPVATTTNNQSVSTSKEVELKECIDLLNRHKLEWDENSSAFLAGRGLTASKIEAWYAHTEEAEQCVTLFRHYADMDDAKRAVEFPQYSRWFMTTLVPPVVDHINLRRVQAMLAVVEVNGRPLDFGPFSKASSRRPAIVARLITFVRNNKMDWNSVKPGLTEEAVDAYWISGIRELYGIWSSPDIEESQKIEARRELCRQAEVALATALTVEQITALACK